MSRRKGKHMFCGYMLTKREMSVVQGLIGMTCARFGIHKKRIKREEIIWFVTREVFGLDPIPGEHFIHAVVRIKAFIEGMGLHARNEAVSKANTAKIESARISYMTPLQRKQHADLQTPITTFRGHSSAVKFKPTVATKDDFYKSWEWRTLRMEAIKEFGRSCQCCGAAPGMKDAAGQQVRICVDHIKPISKFWHLRLDRSNLQILCDECNQGKGNWDETDFRPVVEDEPELDQAIVAQLTDYGTGRLQ